MKDYEFWPLLEREFRNILNETAVRELGLSPHDISYRELERDLDVVEHVMWCEVEGFCRAV